MLGHWTGHHERVPDDSPANHHLGCIRAPGPSTGAPLAAKAARAIPGRTGCSDAVSKGTGLGTAPIPTRAGQPGTTGVFRAGDHTLWEPARVGIGAVPRP